MFHKSLKGAFSSFTPIKNAAVLMETTTFSIANHLLGKDFIVLLFSTEQLAELLQIDRSSSRFACFYLYTCTTRSR